MKDFLTAFLMWNGFVALIAGLIYCVTRAKGTWAQDVIVWTIVAFVVIGIPFFMSRSKV